MNFEQKLRMAFAQISQTEQGQEALKEVRTTGVEFAPLSEEFGYLGSYNIETHEIKVNPAIKQIDFTDSVRHNIGLALEYHKPR